MQILARFTKINPYKINKKFLILDLLDNILYKHSLIPCEVQIHKTKSTIFFGNILLAKISHFHKNKSLEKIYRNKVSYRKKILTIFNGQNA